MRGDGFHGGRRIEAGNFKDRASKNLCRGVAAYVKEENLVYKFLCLEIGNSLRNLRLVLEWNETVDVLHGYY